MEKNVSAIFALSSFILYFEFCVQILVPPSGLKDWSNSIHQLRNQFQMLNVTNRSWKFGVGRKGRSRDSHLGRNPVFLPELYSFRVHHKTKWALWLQDVEFSTVAQSSCIVGRVSNLVE